ncbi:phage terminase large subunit [Fimbriiglobus ruber]|uniref:Phage-related protein n=1 Tax=Fimbriiglobus ruber TaxID=1908690 RepID=A0A225E100_9BACT|nr:phage terminase large subunit [Fimbriiglobus ruber]OWK42047.1 Phage-related protein [Fimbriiglobus ruber]
MTSSEPRATEDEIRQAVIKAECEEDHLFFTRYFFKTRQNLKFIVNWHHHLIADALQRVLDGKCQNLIINVPPGSSKTEMAVINFIARGLALNPNARFLHITSGDDLALLNSQTARDIVQSDEYQENWPLQIADDAKAKKRWNVIVDGKKAGGVYAVSLGGQITGFRAGHMAPGFQGAIILDDLLKADEAYSPAAIKATNRRLLSTVKSRKANPATPVILIMQRVGENDPTGFIKGGNLPGNWEYVTIPALIDHDYVATLPEKLRPLVVDTPQDDKGRFSYWPYKEPLDDMLALEAGQGADADGNTVSRFVFSSQYQQAPRAIGGNIIKGLWFPRANPPKILFRKIYGDTAQKTAERNDYTVFECWGYGEDKKIHLLDLLRGKWEAPELKRQAIDFWNKHHAVTGLGVLRELVVEDKSSGTGLIQEIKRTERIPVRGMERNKDKLTRVMDAVGFIEAGFVVLPENAPFVSDFLVECEAFTADDSHAHDDQIDPMCDAIADMLAAKPKSFFDVT